MAPLPTTLLTIISRDASPTSTSTADPTLLPSFDAPISPMAVHELARRTDSLSSNTNWQPGAGAKDPSSFNNVAAQVSFALIGAGMVIVAIWFFFIHPNGGFKWGKNDWDDYKSTVLRRKGPDGKTLSNATKSTKLGGGSVVHGGSYGAYTEYTAPSSYGDTSTSGYTEKSEMREVHAGQGMRGGGEDKKKKKKTRKNKEKDPELAGYREEKAARVGGLNRQADGSYFDYSQGGSEVSNNSQKPLVEGKPKDKKQVQKDRARREREEEKERKREAKAAEKSAAEAAKKEKENAKKEREAEKQREKEKAKESKAKSKDKKNKKSTPTEVSTALSVITEEPAPPPRAAIADSPRQDSIRRNHRSAPSAAYSFTTGDDANTQVSSARDTATVYTGTYTNSSSNDSRPSRQDSYLYSYRPHAAPPQAHNNGSPRHSRESSPRKQHRSSNSYARYESRSRPGSTTDVTSSSAYSHSQVFQGLKAESVAPGESVSQVCVPTNAQGQGRRGRNVMDGYRRGHRSRRDSLSDSGED